ncbi:MAG TPA: hypothetical protein DEP56_12595 [Pseudomonas sp.]|nr:hypothetical protein [Pseudomonas sp.]
MFWSWKLEAGSWKLEAGSWKLEQRAGRLPCGVKLLRQLDEKKPHDSRRTVFSSSFRLQTCSL